MALILAPNTEARRSLSSRPGLQRELRARTTQKNLVSKSKKRKRNPAKTSLLLCSHQRQFKSPAVLLSMCPVSRLSSAPRHFKPSSCWAAVPGTREAKGPLWAPPASSSPVAHAPLADSFQFWGTLNSEQALQPLRCL